MCGICGKLNYDASRPVDPGVVRSMMDVMRHRGPDEEGMYVDGNVGLGHRRLSIIDLETGRQPLCNEDETVWTVFNGEIYNFPRLREHLVAKGHEFRTRSDTEVIVHLYEEYGAHAVERLHGMFALAVWDENKRVLMVARDRVGIKPLYYAETAEGVVFASELKAILKDPQVRREINLGGIRDFLTYLYVPGENTLVKCIRKLLPGHYLEIRNNALKRTQYWDLDFTEKDEWESEDEACEALKQLLRDTVREHMISDVPVGFLLSGGVDSSGLLSFAVHETDKHISTFTIGFEGQEFADERPYARLAAREFGTSHYETTIGAGDFVDFLPKYVWHMEEPVCEPPAVALHFVSQLARQHVKVVMSGEGGDEAFAGYQNYRNMIWLERIKRLIGPFGYPAASLLHTCSRLPKLGRLAKYVPLMTMPLETYYFSRTSTPYQCFHSDRDALCSDTFRSELGLGGCEEQMRFHFNKARDWDKLSQMLYVDTKMWLPDDLLIKADKITMANSLELRVPLLDHRVLEFAARLPSALKLKLLRTKHILKQALRSEVPPRIINRKKTGFPVPIESWLKSEIRDFVRDILFERRALERGYFRPEALDKLLEQQALDGRGTKELFGLVVLELWHRAFLDESNCAAAAVGYPGEKQSVAG